MLLSVYSDINFLSNYLPKIFIYILKWHLSSVMNALIDESKLSTEYYATRKLIFYSQWHFKTSKYFSCDLLFNKKTNEFWSF